jgi:hypothetical protein
MSPARRDAWIIQGVRMKRKRSSRGSERVSSNEEARVEMQSFLEALNSYPERFARNPGVSFAQHHSSLIPVERNGSDRAKQGGCDAQEN